MTLEELGWCDAFAQHFPFENPALIPARIAIAYRDSYLLYSADGEMNAVLTGSLARILLREGNGPVTGDWVAAYPPVSGGPARIARILPRSTAFKRKPPISGGRKLMTFEGKTQYAGGDTVEQVIAANMDYVIVVAGLDGEFSIPRIRRYLILAERSGARSMVVLNKVDLGVPDMALGELLRLAPNIPVLPLSAVTGSGLEALRAFIEPASTLALVGSSGVGKSSIANRLLGEERQFVNRKSNHTGKGRHTTSRRELVPIPGGGFLLDTPGMREIQLWADADDVSRAFGDLESLAAGCRFPDCRHLTEPGCVIKAAIAAGDLDPATLEAYRDLSRETRYLAQRREDRSRALDKRKLADQLNRSRNP